MPAFHMAVLDHTHTHTPARLSVPSCTNHSIPEIHFLLSIL